MTITLASDSMLFRGRQNARPEEALSSYELTLLKAFEEVDSALAAYAQKHKALGGGWETWQW